MSPSSNVYGRESIRITPDGFSFFKPDGGKLKTRTFPSNSGALLTTEAPLFFPLGQHIDIVAARHVPMLVPAELHDPVKESCYLALQYDTAQLGATFADTVGAYKAVYFLTKNELDAITGFRSRTRSSPRPPCSTASSVLRDPSPPSSPHSTTATPTSSPPRRRRCC